MRQQPAYRHYRPTPPNRQLRKRPHRYTAATLVAFFLALLISLGIGYHSLHSREPDDTAAATDQTLISKATSPTPTATPVRDFAPEVRKLIANHPELVIGVSVIDLTTNKQVDLGTADSFTAASTTKILTAVLFLQKVEAGTYNLDQDLGPYSAEFQLQQLVNQSNNDSWAYFNDLLGYPAQQAFATQLGLTSYQWQQNKLSAHDMALLLQKLYQNQLLNKEDTALLLSYMQHTEEERFIPPAVPSGDKLYHKIGLLDDNAHDAAIIDNGTHPFVLTIYTNGKGYLDYDSRATVFQQITKAVLAAMGG